MSRTLSQNSNVIGNNNQNIGNIVKSYNNKFKGCAISISEDKGQVPEWLSPWTSRERHGTVRNTRADGVGDWLLQEAKYSTWHELENAKPVLLCYGDPGVGKTYISSLVIDSLSKGTYREPVAITYVYCDFTAREVQSVRNLMGSVLRQVISAMSETPSEVLDAFEHARKYADGCRLQLSEILTMLVRYLSNLKRNFICIDALDEFPQKERPELWMSLRRLTQKCPGTRLFLTGRPHIGEEVRKHFPETVEMLQIGTRAGDVGLYLKGRLEGDPELDAMDEELQADILKVIPEKISGIFLLIRINMDAILAEPTIHGRRQVLDRMTYGRGLQDAYSETVERIREQGGSKARLGIEALMWICHCERPLSPDELCHALGVELRTEDFNMDNVPSFRAVLGCALGLVTAGEKDSTVRLLHLTLKEYLGEHPTLFPTAHSMMAEVCLTYLNSRFIRTMDVGPDTALKRAPFLEYATCSWGTHTSTEVTETLKSLALRLLSEYENNLSATILWRKIRKWSFMGDINRIGGLHCIAYWGIEEIAIAMLDMKRWDINAQDLEGGTPLSWALQYGKGKLVELFSEQGEIEPDKVNQRGRTVLSFAAELGHESVVELLLERGDVNADLADESGRTPLSYAAQWGSEDLVKILLERGDVNADFADNGGRTPLSYAAGSRSEGAVNILLERGDVNADFADNRGRTLLSYAAQWGREGLVKILLERGDVNADLADKGGRTPLSYAAGSKSEGVVKLFLERGHVNANLADNRGRTPLSYAAGSSSERAVQLFPLHQGVRPHSAYSNPRTPLSFADSRYRGLLVVDVMKLLLQHRDINPDPVDRDGRTPLSFAAENGLEAPIRLLLGCVYVNPNSQDRNCRTPLSFATSGGHHGVVKLLLEHRGVNPNLPDINFQTPLSLASSGGRQAVVKLLLELEDINPNTPDCYGCTPLSSASWEGHTSVVKLLLDHARVNPNSQDCNGRTPLSLAAEAGAQSVASLLLEREDVNPNLVDNNGRTPLYFAAWLGEEGVVKLLLERRDFNPCTLDKFGLRAISIATIWKQDRIVKLLLERGDGNPD